MLNLLSALPFETQAFIAAIGVIAVMFHISFGEKAAANGPTILTTIGIFATFLAIALGLANFDSSNIQNSIPDLLNNLKTAFWASVAGVGAALTLKFRDHMFGHTASTELGHDKDDVGAIEIIQGLGRVERALVGGEEGSLISQLKFLRTETRDELRLLREAQTKALEKLSEMGSKTLIEALKDVIRDFNKNLTDQFGENFKQLNAAVEKLVQWQEQYRLHVESTTEKLNEMQRAFEKTSSDYAVVVEKASSFAKIADALGLIIVEMEVRHRTLNDQSQSLAALLLQASGSLPEVERKMVELARQLSDGLAENRRVLDAALKEHVATIRDGAQVAAAGIAKTSDDAAQMMSRTASNANEQLLAVAKQIQDRIDENQKAIGRAMQEHAQGMSKSIQGTVETAIAVTTEQTKRISDMSVKTQTEVTGFAKDLQKMMGESQQSVSKTISEGSESLRQSMRTTMDAMTAANQAQNQQLAEIASKTKEQVAALDAALGEELERSLKSLGTQLTALSQKFVQDYLPLTESLARLIEAARRSNQQ